MSPSGNTRYGPAYTAVIRWGFLCRRKTTIVTWHGWSRRAYEVGTAATAILPFAREQLLRRLAAFAGVSVERQHAVRSNASR